MFEAPGSGVQLPHLRRPRAFSVHVNRSRRASEGEHWTSMEEIGRNESIRVTIDKGAVVAEGDIDLAGGPLLDTAILRLEASGPVVIDLTAVEFIDSSGLRSLLTASRRAEGRNSVVVLRNPSAGVKRLLSITGTADQFQIEDGDGSLAAGGER